MFLWAWKNGHEKPQCFWKGRANMESTFGWCVGEIWFQMCLLIIRKLIPGININIMNIINIKIVINIMINMIIRVSSTSASTSWSPSSSSSSSSPPPSSSSSLSNLSNDMATIETLPQHPFPLTIVRLQEFFVTSSQNGELLEVLTQFGFSKTWCNKNCRH